MQTVLGTLIVFALVMFAMAAGVMLTGRRLKGSCGGPGANCPCTETERQTCPRRPR